MGYIGNTYKIQCGSGGFTNNPNIDIIAPDMFVSPSRNITLHQNGIGKRNGTSKVNASAFTGTPAGVGIFDFILEDGTQYIVSATADGKIYKNATETIKTGLTASKTACMVSFANELYFTNGADTVQTWNGVAASTSDITSPAADWVAGNQPKQLIAHGSGNSSRLWALGFASGSVYASANGDGKDFSAANVIHIPIYTGDGFGIVGGVEYQDKLIVFGKKQAYFIDDSSNNTADWSYYQAPWTGGAGSWRLIAKTDNDVFVMTEDGDVYSIQAAQEAGDYKKASFAKPAFIDSWIRENIKLSVIDNFHMVYDPEIRAIRIFMTKAGQSNNDTCLLYYIDKTPDRAWMLHDNQSYNSGFSAACSALVRKAGGEYKVYTIDYLGNVWRLESSNKSDDGNAYIATARFAKNALEDPTVRKKLWRGRLVGNAEGSSTVTVKVWMDDLELDAQTVTLGSSEGGLDTFVLDTNTLAGDSVTDTAFDIGNICKRVQVEISNNSANEDFFISQIILHIKPLGVVPT